MHSNPRKHVRLFDYTNLVIPGIGDLGAHGPHTKSIETEVKSARLTKLYCVLGLRIISYLSGTIQLWTQIKSRSRDLKVNLIFTSFYLRPGRRLLWEIRISLFGR